jgi:hypothetical protein
MKAIANPIGRALLGAALGVSADQRGRFDVSAR